METHPVISSKACENVGDVPRTNGLSALAFARRVIIFVLGMSVVLAGVIMVVTPGPAFVVIPLGLAILATEFVWARRLLKNLKARIAAQTGVSDGRLGFWPRVGVMMAALAAVYVVSFGPACWLTHGRDSKLMRIYWPFGWAMMEAPAAVSGPLLRYARWRLPADEALNVPARPDGSVRLMHIERPPVDADS